MSKKLISLVLILCLTLGIAVPAGAAFADVADPDTALAVAVLEGMGIVNGVSENSYSPNTKFTRAQFCALAVRAMGLEDQVSSHERKTLFSDVRSGSWYVGYVNLAYSEGIINGYGDGRFGPDDSVTYGQVATMLLRMLGYTEADIGKVWPTDYANFADDLELSEGLGLGAYSSVNRGQAAELLYNTITTAVNGTSTEYYKTISGVASMETAIVLNTNAANGGSTGLLMACSAGTSGASIEYYSQKNTVSEDLRGYIGTVLLNSAGKVVGFVPDSTDFKDITISSAKASAITDKSENSYRISSGAMVISGDSLYTYGTTGYLQVDGQPGKSARLYYDNEGSVKYIYISTGSSGSDTDAVYAETDSAAGEFARVLGAGSGYSISKNGSAATASDLAKYDVAYYDSATKTIYASDYRITGFIEAASPSAGAAQTMTVMGCELEVLEAAWETLDGFSVGSRVTLLLTDDCKVAAVLSAATVKADMIGVLSLDGGSVTLCGSGLVITSNSLTAADSLYGGLVEAYASSATSISCIALGSSSAKVDISAGTVGTYELAPSFNAYEWFGSGYVYSLSGVAGTGSADLDDIVWTTSLASSYVSYYHINSAGQVDLLLFRDVTGNCYSYGKLTSYNGTEGINLGSTTMSAYNDAVSIKNSSNPSGSTKYLMSVSAKSGFGGIGLAKYSSYYLKTAAYAELTKVAVSASAFYQRGDEWYCTVSGYAIPVSGGVEVCGAIERWYSGESGLLTAISSGAALNVYYDRSLSTGAQVRIVEQA